MIRKQSEGIHWIEFELLADTKALAHGVFLRQGGVSEGPFASLDMGGRVQGSTPAQVAENRARVQKILQVSHLHSACQKHGTTVVYIEKPMQQPPLADALMTAQAGEALMVKHADCQAAIFFDPIQKAIATVHCGWRGNVHNIYAVTLLEMREKMGVHLENVLVGISPSLGPEKAEFIHYREEFPESFWPYQVKPYHFDLWAIARMQLEEAGILPHHIEIASLCTYSHPEDFFSYRRDNKMTGNHATIAMLKI